MPDAKHMTLLMNANDNVASALDNLPAGSVVPVEHADLPAAREVQVVQDIPLGHKFALSNIQKGQKVVKFGMVIGVATQDILAGQHVSEHNLE